MDSKLLFETFIPATTIIVVAFLSAEFIGRGKHIGRGFSFFMMLAIIPGVIGLIFSPSAKSKPTKGNISYKFFGLFLIIGGLFSFYQDVENLTIVNFFVLISFFSSAFYCFELGNGNVLNKNPKFYFQNNEQKVIENAKEKLDTSISNLTELRDKGIITDEEYYKKVAEIKTKKAQQEIQNSLEYKQLKSLLDSGVLTQEEFENKIKLIQVNLVKRVSEEEKERLKKYVDSLKIPARTIIGVWQYKDGIFEFWLSGYFCHKSNNEVIEKGSWINKNQECIIETKQKKYKIKDYQFNKLIISVDNLEYKCLKIKDEI